MAEEKEISPRNGVELDSQNGVDGSPDASNDARSKDSTISQTPRSPSGKAKKLAFVEPVEQQNGQGQDTKLASADAQSDAAGLEDEDDVASTQMEVGTDGKKKKKRKPKSKRGLNAPTGFEEFYVDAPLTPAEFEEEKQIYDQSYRFTQRIETAIQRFAAKRRLTSDTKLVFDKYLMSGGIATGPKAFGGGFDVKDKTAAEIRDLAATHFVDSDIVDSFESAHVVDFEGCLRSFLQVHISVAKVKANELDRSRQLPQQWELTSEEHVKKLVGIVRNFLNYLLHHDVCPEYKDQINAARDLCDKAPKELWDLTTMLHLLPGDFNMACSEIFGGMYQGMYSTNESWLEDSEKNDFKTSISPERARLAFKIGIAANANDAMFDKYRRQLSAKECRLVSTEETGFEITEIIHANDTVLGLYAQQQSAGLSTLGKIKAKTWSSGNAPEEDLTEGEEAYLKAHPPQGKQYEFWLEEEILKKCRLGMKFDATVRETSFGLTYFDAIRGVYCSFYQLTPNDSMDDWREIEKEWLPMKYNKWTAEKKAREAQEAPEAIEGLGDEENNTEPKLNGEEVEGAATGQKDDEQLEIQPQAKPEAETEPEPEPEPEEAEVHTNIVAAGYDEDFGKGETEAETETETGIKAHADPQEHNDDTKGTIGQRFGVEVHKTGVEVTKVAVNAEPVVQENFDVTKIHEDK